MGAADIWKARTIRATSPHELQKKIEPGNNQFFWIDDAWGNTQYQRATSEAWNQVFPLMQAAMHKGARFLITSRDYIWNQAKHDLKLHAIPVLAKSQVVINVHDFTTQEKAQILYNHLKLGDQTKEYRSAAKEFLPELAENKNFLPEVARRFGMRFFTGDRLPSKVWAKQFFENPQQFLIETITGLSPECKSAVSLVFQNGGKVRSPVDEDLLNASAKHFGVSPGQVRNELQNLNGSLLLLMSDEEGAFWTYKHPTVGDAFAKYVSESPELVEVYLRGASPSAISQEVVCAGIQLYGAPVIIPNTLHNLLADKISSLPSYEITSFLSYRANKAFAELYLKRHPEILNRLRNFIAPIKEDTDARCAAVLYSFDLLPEENREILARQLKETALESADDSIFDDYSLSQVVPQEERDALISVIKSEVLDRVEEHVERLKAEWSNSYDPDEHFSAFHDSVRIFANLTGDELYAAKVMQAVALAHAKLHVDLIYNEGALLDKWPHLKPKPKRKIFEPTDDELARLLAQKMPENLRRWIMNAMATVGRPTAVLELTPASRNRAHSLVNLNPEGRRQNKKFRASVREPKAMTKWLDQWEGRGKQKMKPEDRYCSYASESSIDTALARACAPKKANLPGLSLYSFRHLGTSVLRRAKVPKEQIDYQLGHRQGGARSTQDYGQYEADYLAEASAALNAWIERILALVAKSHGNPTKRGSRRPRSS